MLILQLNAQRNIGTGRGRGRGRGKWTKDEKPSFNTAPAQQQPSTTGRGRGAPQAKWNQEKPWRKPSEDTTKPEDLDGDPSKSLSAQESKVTIDDLLFSELEPDENDDDRENGEEHDDTGEFKELTPFFDKPKKDHLDKKGAEPPQKSEHQKVENQTQKPEPRPTSQTVEKQPPTVVPAPNAQPNEPKAVFQAQTSNPFPTALDHISHTQPHTHLNAQPLPNTQSQPQSNPNQTQPAWFYIDPDRKERGPFTSTQMDKWLRTNWFKIDLLTRRADEEPNKYVPLARRFFVDQCNPFSLVPLLQWMGQAPNTEFKANLWQV